jgi:DNA-binding winged helix-turn-helix (wHTH) protein
MTVLRKIQKKSKRITKDDVSTTIAIERNHVYQFGPFSLNQMERLLLRDGEPVHLAPKAFEVLLVLIQNKGCLVTKERLLREVWPEVFVEEANLSVNIASLRKALDDGEVDAQWIETVPKQGYRFLAEVSEIACGETIERPHLVECHQVVDEVNQSIAVLRFANEGCGPAGDYLSAGLAESITNNLSRSRGLRVMARHTVDTCHQFHIDPRTVGHKLGVRLVLVGRILRLGDRLIVRTELVDVIDGWQVWGEQYHAELADVLGVQHELTAAISERVRSRLSLDDERSVIGPQPLPKHATSA